MVNRENKKAQAAIELAIFGAILIFLISAIVQSSFGNSYTQSQNFKLMRMAMLASWKGSQQQNISRSNASLLFVEDRLSPDIGKYGSLDRSPFIAQGSGTFSYMLLYPVTYTAGGNDITSNLPIQDVYINGQHFPFTTASYVASRVISNPPAPYSENGGTVTPPSCGAGAQSGSTSVAQDTCLQACASSATPQQCEAACQTSSQSQCLVNQCLRDAREWINSSNGVKASQFQTIVPVPLSTAAAPGLTVAQTINQIAQNNAIAIFNQLASDGMITGVNGSGINNLQGNVSLGFKQVYQNLQNAPVQYSCQYNSISKTYTNCPTTVCSNTSFVASDVQSWGLYFQHLALPCGFDTWFVGTFPTATTVNTTYTYTGHAGEDSAAEQNAQADTATEGSELGQIQSILVKDQPYKLFYEIMANGTDQFSTTPPVCSTHPCKDKELSQDLVMTDVNGYSFPNYGTNPVPSAGSGIFTEGDMMYDLQRNGNYYKPSDPTAVESQFPLPTPTQPSLRPYIAWQWGASSAIYQADASGGTDPALGVDPGNNEYPTYDIDGRLKEVTLYAITWDASGNPIVSYEDPEGGDMDLTWDSNSCTPKPGLQSDAQIYTFTEDGTYLQIKEGKLYNPETDQFVRSANKKDNVDLIQRQIQLSNNTGRFCNPTPSTTTCDGTHGVSCASPNPVEVCVNGTGCPDGPSCNCFSTEPNIKSTCFDETDNMLFIRSRLQDQRGHFWATDTSGQLSIK